MKSSRFKMREVTLGRVAEALLRRVKEIPHAISWDWSRLSGQNNQRLEYFRDKHRNERCFLLANGPSLRNVNLDLLKSEVSFGLNRIYLLFEQFEFRPTYHVCVNELILKQFSHEIDSLSLTKFLNWRLRKFYTPSENTIFIKENYSLKDDFRPDATHSVTSGGTVTYVALQIAYFMGFKEVIILGLDHDFVEKGIPSKTEIRKAEKDESHFHPDYFPKGSVWQLPDLARSELNYRLAREWYEKSGRRIIDATEGGKCQIFERVILENIL